MGCAKGGGEVWGGVGLDLLEVSVDGDADEVGGADGA